MTPTAADRKAWSELLDGLPDDLRYTPLDGNKCPIDPDTGYPRNKWETFHYLPSDLDQMNGVVKAVGLHLGPTSNGVMAVDFDGRFGLELFEKLVGRSPMELPATVRWTSGLAGHYQCLYRVPKEHWEGLQTKKLKWKDHPKREHFELRWIGQSVIAGEHPDKLLSNGYYFEEGHSPKDVEIAAVPDWLLEFFQQECRPKGKTVIGKPVTVEIPTEEKPKSFIPGFARAELLYDISRTREIVSDWLHPADDHNDYDTWTMVGMVCAYLSAAIGEPMLLFDLWNDWSSEQSNYDGEDALAKKWESFDRDGDDALKFGTLHDYATENTDWKASQTQEEFVETLPEPEKKAAKSHKLPKHEVIAGLMKQLYELEKTGGDWNKRASVRSELYSACHIDKAEVQRRLFEMAADEFDLQINDNGPVQRTTRNLAEDALASSTLEPLIPGFLHRGCDAVMFGDKGSGKTFKALGLSYHACCGGTPFDRDTPVDPENLGRTLWIGSDGGEGAEKMIRDYVRMIGAPSEGQWRQRINVWAANRATGDTPWAFSVRGLIQLLAELESKQGEELPYNLVVIDTLKCVMDLADLNFGIGPVGVVMRLMQAVAARFNVAILWLHHSKQGAERAGGNSNIVEVPYSVIALYKKESPQHDHLVRCVVEKYRGESSRSYHYTLDRDIGLFKIVEGEEVQVNPLLYEVWIGRDAGTSMTDIVKAQPHLSEGTVRNKCTALRKEGLLEKKKNKWWPTEKGAKQMALDMPETAGEVNEWLGAPPKSEAA